MNTAFSPGYNFEDCLEGEDSVMEGSGGVHLAGTVSQTASIKHTDTLRNTTNICSVDAF